MGDWLPTIPQVEVNGPFGPEDSNDKKSWLVRSVSDTGHSVEFYDKREAVAFARDVNVMLKEMFPGTRAGERLPESYVLRDRTEKGRIDYKEDAVAGHPDGGPTDNGTTNADDSKPMTPREAAVKLSLRAAWERGAVSVQRPITDQEARDATAAFMRADHPYEPPGPTPQPRTAWLISSQKGDIRETTVYWDGVKWIENTAFALRFMDLTAAVLFAEQLKAMDPRGLSTVQPTRATF